MENEKTLATEILHELKASSKRWFIAFIITLLLWFGTIGLFLWYISLPVEEYDLVADQNATNRSFNIIGGEYNYGGSSNIPKEIQEESYEK